MPRRLFRQKPRAYRGKEILRRHTRHKVCRNALPIETPLGMSIEIKNFTPGSLKAVVG